MVKVFILTLLFSIHTNHSHSQRAASPIEIDPGFYGMAYYDTLCCKEIIVFQGNMLRRVRDVKYIYLSKDKKGDVVLHDDKKRPVNVYLIHSAGHWQQVSFD